MADMSDLTHDKLHGHLRIQESEGDQIIIIDSKNYARYKLPYAMNTVFKEDIVKFVKDFQAGTLTPYVMSGVYDHPIKDGIKKLIANKWSEYVYDPTKDVLVTIYKDMTLNEVHMKVGHEESLKFLPIVEELAKQVEDIDDLVIATLELNHNELTGFAVNDVPAVKFYPKHDKTPAGTDLPIGTTF